MIDTSLNGRSSNHRAMTISASPVVDGGDPGTAMQGFRLHRLEVFNWGTFDGQVHSIVLDGQTTLLVGKNGAGKSTLVDALLTLLVKPGKSRNYNLAAGAKHTERSKSPIFSGHLTVAVKKTTTVVRFSFFVAKRRIRYFLHVFAIRQPAKHSRWPCSFTSRTVRRKGCIASQTTNEPSPETFLD